MAELFWVGSYLKIWLKLVLENENKITSSIQEQNKKVFGHESDLL